MEVHFDITVDAVDYVSTLLGIEMRDCRVVYLRVPGSDGVFVELLEYHGSDARPTPEPRSWDPGTGHLCFHVSDAQGLLHGCRRGRISRPIRPGASEIPMGPNKGGRAAYLIDPDGYHIELFQRPRTSAPAAPSLASAHPTT